MSKPGIALLIQTISAVKILEETEVYPEERVYIYGFHIRVSKQLKTWYALNLGSELVIDGYIRETIEREQSGLDHKRLALTIGQDFLPGRVAFSQHFGFYVYSPYKAKNPVYQKYELAYKFTPQADGRCLPESSSAGCRNDRNKFKLFFH